MAQFIEIKLPLYLRSWPLSSEDTSSICTWSHSYEHTQYTLRIHTPATEWSLRRVFFGGEEMTLSTCFGLFLKRNPTYSGICALAATTLLNPLALTFFYFYTCESDLHVSLSFLSVQTDTEQSQQSEETLQGCALVGISVTIQSADYTTVWRQVV